MKKFLLALSLMFAGAACFFMAACGNPKYTFSFETNGGNAIAATEYEVGTEVTLPVPEAREGYEFAGWYLTEDFGGEPVTTYTVGESNVTFYAKWNELGEITLDLDGGTLSAGTTLYLAEGENVYNFMQAYVPVKGNLTFGGWFVNGSTALSETATMGDSLSLTARYMVGYTMEVYAQDADLAGYTLHESVQGSGYVGAEVEAGEYAFPGFSRAENDDEVLSVTLSEDASANVLKVYYDRNEIVVTFMPNYPDGTQGQPSTVETVYGDNDVALPGNDSYACDGYFLAGWSTSPDGELEYALNEIEALAVNGDAEAQPDEFAPESSLALYGVWVKGYDDMFGGGDKIFLFDAEGTDIYLNRGGVYIKGTYTAATSTFYFSDGYDEEIVFSGKLNSDGTFSYADEARDSYTASLYTVAGGKDDSVRISFDEYNGFEYRTYDVDDEGNIGAVLASSSGTYTVDESGYYVLSFNNGELAGQTMEIMRATLGGSNVFLVRNNADLELGVIYRGTIYGGNLTYYTQAYMIALDGFCNAVYRTESSTSTYLYKFNEDRTQITLLDPTWGSEFLVGDLMEISGENAYIVYNSAFDNVFESESGATLEFDGYYTATYTDGQTTFTGVYELLANSVFGGVVLSVTDGSQTRTFIVNSYQVGEGEEAAVEYVFEEKANGYAEYRYQAEGMIYGAPLVVLNDEAQGFATLYGYNETSGEYIVVSTGTYLYDDKTGEYVYTAATIYKDAEVSKEPVDLASVTKVTFKTSSSTTTSGSTVNVFYWLSAVINDEEAGYSVVYTAQEGITLTITAGDFATLTIDDTSFVGTFTTDEDSNVSAVVFVISGSTQVLYVELNEEDKTFVILDTLPYEAKDMFSKAVMAFDGKGGAVYTDAEGKQYSGTYEVTDEKSGDYTVYKFVSDGLTFNFIQPATSDDVYFVIYNEQFDGTFRSAQYGRLELDGYFNATYVSGSQTYTGIYSVSGEGLIVIATDSRYIYIDYETDLDDFTVKGEEYGAYIVVDNQNPTGLYVEMDGYGKGSVFMADEEAEDGIKYIDEDASYTIDGDSYALTYTDGAQEITLYGTRGVMVVSSSSAVNVFILEHKEVTRTYVNQTDWSVYVLDSYGNVVRYNSVGVAETGSYTLITDTLLYYVNSEGSDASLFTYDSQSGTMSPIKLTDRAYYTADLEGLQFTKYGYAVFNGETRYYYNIVNNNVVIYHRDEENEEANEYGFLEESFGTFGTQVEWNDKTYYANNGFTITFSRDAATAEEYPIPYSENEDGELISEPLESLTFTPTGAEEFTVSGTVIIADNEFDCYVSRVLGEDGKYSMSLIIALNSNAYYVYDITTTYRGSNIANSSVYTISGMRHVVEYQAYKYLYYYYMAYYLYAQQLPNTFGIVTISTEYNAAGEAGEAVLAAQFGGNSGMYDTEGNLLSIEGVSFESESGVYHVVFDGADGYTYGFYFTTAYMQQLGVYGYQVIAMVREETLTDSKTGITVEIERVIASDSSNYTAGSIFSMSLSKDGEQLENALIGYFDDKLCYIIREEDAEGNKTTTYYWVEFTEGASEDENVIPLYTQVSVTEEAVTTYYTSDGNGYIDVDGENNVLIIGIYDEESEQTAAYIAVSSTYDENTKTYTVNLSETVAYTVTVGEDGSVTMQLVEQTEDEESGAEDGEAA